MELSRTTDALSRGLPLEEDGVGEDEEEEGRWLSTEQCTCLQVATDSMETVFLCHAWFIIHNINYSANR